MLLCLLAFVLPELSILEGNAIRVSYRPYNPIQQGDMYRTTRYLQWGRLFSIAKSHRRQSIWRWWVNPRMLQINIVRLLATSWSFSNERYSTPGNRLNTSSVIATSTGAIGCIKGRQQPRRCQELFLFVCINVSSVLLECQASWCKKRLERKKSLSY